MERLRYLPQEESYLEQAAPSARWLEPLQMVKLAGWSEPPGW
jgi:hypothetical protein